MHLFSTAITSVIVLISTMAVCGQQQPPTEAVKGQATSDTKVQIVPKTKGNDLAKEKDKPKTSMDEEAVITHHQIAIDGKEFAYTATTGLMPLKDAKGEVEARIFFVAYTRDDSGPSAERALMFSFNGGPGSASVWLHLGALGPRRVDSPEEPTIPTPPFRLVANEATWLDRTDLVFIDPVGTGYSRAAKPELNSKFHALRGDITSVGEFVRMYLSRYDRWSSPLFLIGESYGTTRAAAWLDTLSIRVLHLMGWCLSHVHSIFRGSSSVRVMICLI